MSGDRQHPLLRHRRPRNWAALFAVFALLAWTVEFATHLHVPHEAQVSAQSSHFCEMCASFQAGAGIAAAAPQVPKVRPALVQQIVVLPPARPQLAHSYHSRAPPHA